MSSVNYVVVDSLEIKFEVNKSIGEDEADAVLNNISRIFEEAENIEGDVLQDNIHNAYTNTVLYMMAYKIFSVIRITNDEYCFFDYMLIGWLKNEEIPYRIISEYALDNEDEPARKYLTISKQ